MNEKELLKQRDAKAEALGEGHWLNQATKEWCPVDVTFYPTTKVWITEAGKRRETTLAELKQNYHRLEV